MEQEQINKIKTEPFTQMASELIMLNEKFNKLNNVLEKIFNILDERLTNVR